MKEKKDNIRSFRYSDKVAKILEAAEGKTLNEKFENLVLSCYDTLPRVKEEVESYRRLADIERERYYSELGASRKFDGLLSDLRMLKGRFDKVMGDIDEEIM